MKGEASNEVGLIDAEIVCDAMIAADACGRAFREAARAREYTVP
jgi:hypothetical protein